MSLVLNPPGVTGKEGTSIQRLARNTKIPLHKQEKSQGKRIIKEKTKVWEGCPEYCYQNRFSFSLQELSHESYIKGVATKIEYKEKKNLGNIQHMSGPQTWGGARSADTGVPTGQWRLLPGHQRVLMSKRAALWFLEDARLKRLCCSST